MVCRSEAAQPVDTGYARMELIFFAHLADQVIVPAADAAQLHAEGR